jgi:hypothetical protein
MRSSPASPAPRFIKMLVLGESGSGKTGALASLLQAGYNVRIFDADGTGEELLRSLAPDAGERLAVLPLAERFTPVNGMLFPLRPDGWLRLCDAVRKWLGGIHTWTARDVLVIDTLTTIGRLAYYHARKIAGRESALESGKLWQQDIGNAQALCIALMDMLHGDGVPCHVIVNCHINRTFSDGLRPTDLDYEQARAEKRIIKLGGYPVVIGAKAGVKVPIYFGNMLYLHGAGKDALFHTTPIDGINVKTTAPSSVKRTYKQATGLAELFADLASSPATPAPQQKESNS